MGEFESRQKFDEYFLLFWVFFIDVPFSICDLDTTSWQHTISALSNLELDFQKKETVTVKPFLWLFREFGWK
jgi:hypothetical protein